MNTNNRYEEWRRKEEAIGNKIYEKFVKDNYVILQNLIFIPNTNDVEQVNLLDLVKFHQFNHTDNILDFGIRIPMYNDLKNSLGIKDLITKEIVFPGYYKLTMEMYYYWKGDANKEVYKGFPFLVEAYPYRAQYITYVSPLMVITIPKEGLNRCMKLPQYKSLFDTSKTEWELNKSDNKKQKMVKNITLDLKDEVTVLMLLTAGAQFFRFVETMFIPYNPILCPPSQIKKESPNPSQILKLWL